MPSKNSKLDFFLLSIGSDVLDTLAFGIYVVNSNGIIEYFNPAMLKIAGAKSLEEVKGLNVLTLENYKKSGLTKYFIQGLAGKSFEIDSIKYTSYSGKKTSYRHYYGIPIKNSNGIVEKLFCIVEDITNNVVIEENLKKNEAKFKALVQMSPDCIKLFDPDLKIAYMNPAGLLEHGLLNTEEACNFDFLSSIDVDHRERFRRAFSNVKKGLSVSVLVKHIPDKSDRDWCHVSLAPIKDPDGKITSILGVSRDISKVKNVEKTLNDQMLEVEKMNKLMIGREVKMSELKKQIFELQNSNSVDYKVIKEINKNGIDKQYKSVLVSGDISKIHISGKSPFDSQKKYDRLVEFSLDAIIEVDQNLKVILWNPAAEKIFSYTKKEMLSQSIKKIIPEKYLKIVDQKIKELYKSNSDKKIIGLVIEADGLAKGAKEVNLEISLSFERGDFGYFITAIVRDVTETKMSYALMNEKINDTERLNKYLINRELKMIELKKQIAKLNQNNG